MVWHIIKNCYNKIVQVEYIYSFDLYLSAMVEDSLAISYQTVVGDVKVAETSREVITFEPAKSSSEKIEGFRNLYLACTNVDGIKLSNLIVK